MKKRRNSSIATCFWVILVLLFILGLITHTLRLNTTIFPEEDSHSQISNTASHDVDSNFTTSESTKQENTSIKDKIEDSESTSQSSTTSETESVTEPTVTQPEETTQPSETEPAVKETDESLIETDPVKPIAGTIFLTFDDGPSLSITPQILDILKSNNITATFFIVDYEYGSEKEDLVKRAGNDDYHDNRAYYLEREHDELFNTFVNKEQGIIDLLFELALSKRLLYFLDSLFV